MTQQAGQKASVFDVVVIGGGAAGLSAGLVLGRSRRSVVLIDGGEPRNAPAAGVHGFLSRDGVSPADLIAAGRAEVEGYGGVVRDGQAVSARRTEVGFEVTLADGAIVSGRRLLVTTGLVDELPEVEGVRELWGRDVLHCPYCHGWEVRDEPLGILGTGPFAAHQALHFRQWSSDITLFAHTSPELTAEQSEELAARGITVVAGQVAGLEISDGRLRGVRLADGTVVPRTALVVGPRFMARSSVLLSLGLEPTQDPRGMGEYIASDPMGLTAVPGVWVAGNVTDLMAQVVMAAAAGVRVATAINVDLMAEETQIAVAAHRELLAVS